MAGRTFVFDPPDRFVAGAVGQPGQRTFFLQATKGRAVLSVGLEKAQVALLAERIGQLLGELRRRGLEPSLRSVPAAGALEEPVVEAFRVGSMTLTYDGERHDLVLEARSLAEETGGPAEGGDEPPDEPGPDSHLLRVRLTLAGARAFAEGAMRVVAAGRPPCPICGEPLSPQGHVCLRRNGYVM